MQNNSSDEIPYAAWHCEELNSIDNALLDIYCPECGCKISFVTGVISKFIKKDDDAEYDEEYENFVDIAFLKWMKLQHHRDDIVGDFSREFIATRNYENKGTVPRSHFIILEKIMKIV